MNIKRYFVKNPLLKKYIKFIWITDDSVETEISHLLLPVNNIDIILN